MSKYDALGAFLKNQRNDRVPMSFAEVERVTGRKLPPSAAKHRAWWSNNPNNSVMTRVWLDAGFESEQVDMAGRKLVFRRVRKPVDSPGRESGGGREGKDHPLLGAMEGVMGVAPAAGLTKPAGPRLGRGWGSAPSVFHFGRGLSGGREIDLPAGRQPATSCWC